MLANLTHYDLDGVVSHIILLNLFPDRIRYYSCGYEKLENKIDKIIEEKAIFDINTIIVTDISLNEQLAEKLAKNFINVFLFDHHESTKLIETKLNKFISTIIIDTGVCGAQLVYNGFKTKLEEKINPHQLEHLKSLVEYTNLFDTWQTKDVNFSYGYYLSQLFFMMGWENFVNTYRYGMVPFTSQQILNLKKELNQKKIWIREAQKIEFGEDAVVLITEHGNDIVNESTIYYDNYNVFFIFNPTINKMSIRIKKYKCNIGEILNKLNSENLFITFGGHSLAGGFVIKNNYTQEQFEYIINKIYEEIIK